MSKESKASISPFESSIQSSSGPGDTPSVDLRKLAVLAKQAYDQKRTKHCLALTKALLLFDPDNEDAHAIQGSIRSDIQREIENARALLEDGLKKDPEKYRQAVEGVLWKILNVDPENEEAKSLLSKVKTPLGASSPAPHHSSPDIETETWRIPPVPSTLSEVVFDPAPAVSAAAFEPEPVSIEANEPPEVVWSPPPPVDWPAMEAELTVAPESHEAVPGLSHRVEWSDGEARLTLTPEPESHEGVPTPRFHLARPTEEAQHQPEVLSYSAKATPSPLPPRADWIALAQEAQSVMHSLQKPKEVVQERGTGTRTLWRLAIPAGLLALLVVAAILVPTGRDDMTLQPEGETNASAVQGSGGSVASTVPAVTGSTGIADGVIDGQLYSNDQSLDAESPNSLGTPPAVLPADTATAPVAAVVPPVPVVTPGAAGRLALSSPTSVEIYRDGEYLGSTPISLELPPGNHTLEYRHQDLRNTVTHLVRSNETTRSMVTFELTMKINARPWAQVFIEGASRRPLGQTPLSDVRVPMGSTLVFRHPNFPEKTYRVTGRDTAIQVIFP